VVLRLCQACASQTFGLLALALPLALKPNDGFASVGPSMSYSLKLRTFDNVGLGLRVKVMNEDKVIRFKTV